MDSRNFSALRMNLRYIAVTMVSILLLALPLIASAGSQTFYSSGTFTVPNYSTLTVTVNGGGGGGGGSGAANNCDTGGNWPAAGAAGTSGGSSSFNGNVVGNGGGSGGGGGPTVYDEGGAYNGSNGSAGSSGGASGGDTNTTGGGAGGGGGGAARNSYACSPSRVSGAGGAGAAGGRAVKTYSPGGLTPGAGISVVVGSGGNGGNGGLQQITGQAGSAGSAGSVSISWTLPSSARDITITKAVSMTGNVTVLSNLSKGSGTFMIDDPSDPANKLLYHSFVESPDVLNEYTSTTLIGKNGRATVKLPSYFEALNGSYQYFVRPLDMPMSGLYIEQEVENNEFVIGGGVEGGEVSWMVTGIRHDPYILAHPVIPEVEKGPGQLVGKGEYLFAGNAPQCSTFIGCIWSAFKLWF